MIKPVERYHLRKFTAAYLFSSISKIGHLPLAAPENVYFTLPINKPQWGTLAFRSSGSAK